jgi:hypothetical protein
MALPQPLEALYSVAAKAAEHFGDPAGAEGVLDPCGLILEVPPKSGYDWCTPKEALTFASTGGDGVHYSYLSSDKISSGLVPVVMTLPASEELNLVVAESIDELLGLGYHVGWFALEQIVYEPEWALQYFAQPDADAADDKLARMEFLRSELSIQPIALSLDRIANLTERYASFLIVPDEPE